MTNSSRQVRLFEPAVTAFSRVIKEAAKIPTEGIVYLGGWITPEFTIVATTLSPHAVATFGSFRVSSESMANIVDLACKAGLEIVGQLHSHPGEAFHSDGDVDGATLVRDGFISVVVPEYGRYLPDLKDSCVFQWHTSVGFVPITLSNIRVVPDNVDCR